MNGTQEGDDALLEARRLRRLLEQLRKELRTAVNDSAAARQNRGGGESLSLPKRTYRQGRIEFANA